MADKSLGYSITAVDKASQTFVKMALQVDRLAQRLDELDRKRVTVTVDADTSKAHAKIATLDKSFGSATIRIAALGRAMGSLALPGAIVAATPAIASLGSSAVTASGALWLLPAAALAGGAAAATLATGFAHVSDALGPTGTPAQIKKVNEALAALSPQARATVDVIRGLGPAWSSVRLDVQDKLFQGMAKTVGGLAQTYLPVLKAGLGGIAVELNRSAAGLAGWAANKQTVADVGTIFTRTRETMAALAPAAANVAAAILDIGVVGSQFLPGLAGSATSLTERFRAFIAEARQTGQLRVWIQAGLDTLAQLGRISANVGSILKSVFDGAKTSGGSFLGTLEMITNRIATGLRTPAGAAGLQEFFSTVRTLVGLLWDKLVQLWPVVVAGAGAFAALLVAAAPLTDTLLSLVVSALVPILNAIQWLAPVIGPVAVAFFAWSAATEVLVQVMKLAAAVQKIYGAAVVVFSALIHPIATATKLWAAAQAALNVVMLMNPIGLVVIAVAALVAALVLAWNHSETFRNVVIGVWNAIKTAAVAVFGFLRDFIVGTWNNIRDTAITVWNAVAAFFSGAFAVFSQIFSAIWNGIVAVFSAVWNTIRTIALTVWDGIALALGSAFNIFKTIFVVVWGAIAAAFLFVWEGIRHTAVTVWNFVSGFFSAAFAAYSALFSRVWNAISAVFTMVWNFIRNTAVTVWNAIVGFFTPAFNTFSGFFSTVWNAISNVFMTVWNFIRNTAITVWTAISGFFTAAFAVFSAFFSTIWNAIWSFFVNTWNNLRNTAVNAWNVIYGFFQGAFAVFTQFFADVWNNIVATFDRIWSGITAIANRVWDNVKGAFVGAINWIIDKINFFAGAINKVASLLGFNINLHVDRLALGGEVEAVRRAFGGAIEAKQVIRRASGGGVDVSSGGRLPGYTPGRDIYPAVAGGRRYVLGGGEYVTRATSTRAIGPAGMAAINNADRRPVDIVPRSQRERVANYAGGGVVGLALGGPVDRAMAAARPPGSHISSAHRPGDSGYHGQAKALDLTGNLPAINRAIASAHPNSSQLIYTPGINLLNGRPHTYNAATRADHHDHVHWAMDNVAMIRNRALGGGGFFNPSEGGRGAELVRATADFLIGPLRNILVPIRDDARQNLGMRTGAGVGVKLLDHLFAKADEKDAADAGAAMGATSNEAPGIVRIISDVARSRFGGQARHAAVVGTATGLVESGLRNLNYGDRDSLGVFQQRPSMGWGTPAQIMNVSYAAGKFFSKFPGHWARMEPGALAQSVQRSAFPGRYAQRMGQADGLVRQFGGFDRGGSASGRGVMFKDVITPERVLSGRQTAAFEELVAGLMSGRPQQRLADVGVLEQIRASQSVRRGSLVSTTAGGGSLIGGDLVLQAAQGESTADAMRVVNRELRVAKHGGRYRR